jgi:hypothetical protein
LCEQFGISRKSGHKCLSRYSAMGRAGLTENIRRPKASPGSTDESVQRLILSERQRHPTWGPKKLRVLLERVHGIGVKKEGSIFCFYVLTPCSALFCLVLPSTRPVPNRSGIPRRSSDSICRLSRYASVPSNARTCSTNLPNDKPY